MVRLTHFEAVWFGADDRGDTGVDIFDHRACWERARHGTSNMFDADDESIV